MSSNMKKYIGLDVHKEATSIAVLNGAGKLVMESIIEPRQLPCWSSCTVYGESCMRRWTKEPGQAGSRMC